MKKIFIFTATNDKFIHHTLCLIKSVYENERELIDMVNILVFGLNLSKAHLLTFNKYKVQLILEEYTGDVKEKDYIVGRRYHILNKIVQQRQEDLELVMLLDADTIFIKPFVRAFNQYMNQIDLCLYYRNYEGVPENMAVLAGHLYFYNRPIIRKFINNIVVNHECKGHGWWNDQLCVYEEFLKIQSSIEFKNARLGPKNGGPFIDYCFSDKSIIWSGKGSAKRNPKYRAKHEEYLRLL